MEATVDVGKKTSRVKPTIKSRLAVYLESKNQDIEDVYLGSGYLGQSYKKSFNLVDLFSLPETGRFLKPELYLKSESGNIYIIRTNGDVIDIDETKRRKDVTAEELSVKRFRHKTVRIGEPFEFKPGMTTKAIVEIVLTKFEKARQSRLKKSSPIYSDAAHAMNVNTRWQG